MFFIDSTKKKRSTSSTSAILTVAIQNIVKRLRTQCRRDSTRNTYHRVWKIFCKFFHRLDDKPMIWEDRLILFTGFLVDSKLKSSTIHSYISAIRSVLLEDGIKLKENIYVISALTKACKLKNDTILIRLPIHRDLLELILRETAKLFDEQGQLYLKYLYRAVFASACYGLLRIGEVTLSPHALKAKNVHIGTNKKKLLFILKSSKTHCKADKPQSIKLTRQSVKPNHKGRDNTCPYTLLKQYIKHRPDAIKDDEQFFVFGDRTPIRPEMIRHTLSSILI